MATTGTPAPLITVYSTDVYSDATGHVTYWVWLCSACRHRSDRYAGSPREALKVGRQHKCRKRRRICQAAGCNRTVITEFTDGGSRVLALCERHGDLLAVGFKLKPTTVPPSQEWQPTGGGR